MSTSNNPVIVPDIEEEILRVTKKQKDLVIYNDDHHSFDFVIKTLMQVCGHDPLQAEQCTMLIHYKGRCAVKRGDYKSLVPICENILERGLTAKIE